MPKSGRSKPDKSDCSPTGMTAVSGGLLVLVLVRGSMTKACIACLRRQVMSLLIKPIMLPSY